MRMGPNTTPVSNEELVKVNRFAGLPDEVRNWLAGEAKVVNYNTGDFIVCEGEAANQMYAVIFGSVKTFATGSDGKEIIIVVLGKGECFCEISLLGQPVLSINAVALEPTKLITISRETYFSLLQKFPESVLPSFRDLSFRVMALTKRVMLLSTGDVEHRLASLVLSSGTKNGHPNEDTICLSDLSRKDIASMVGARPETIIRIISEWCKNGIAERINKKLCVQIGKLEEIIDSANKPTG